MRAGEILTLERINQTFSAWLPESYHQRTHSETGEPPRGRYEKGRRFDRHVNNEAVLPYFHRREHRTVHDTFSDVQLVGLFFSVHPKLRGDRVEVRFDPFSEIKTVRIYSLIGEYLGIGKRHQREKTSEPPIAEPGKPKHNYLDLLVQKHQQSLDQTTRGIDYQAVLACRQRSWPFIEFVKRLAAVIGRQGGASAFRVDELETLQKVYQRLEFLDEPMLRKACERAEERTIPEIVFLLQQLHHERRK